MTDLDSAEARIGAALSAHAGTSGHPFRRAAHAFEAWDGAAWQGGLIARLGTDWMLVETLAVDAAARGRGVGRRLMAQAEALARACGMTGIWLDTFTFQAPGFYRAQGFAEVGRIADYPLGQARVFFEKRLHPDPRRLIAGDPALPQVLDLIRAAFAPMEGRIDPPSSVHRLTLGTLTADARIGEVWALGDPVAACMILTPREDALYLGKLAVATERLGQGLARRLVDLSCHRAFIHSLPVVELQTRVELTENHATFAALGFTEVARSAHPGYPRPTSVTYRRPAA